MDTDKVELEQVPYYPLKAPDDDRLEVRKFVAKKGASRTLYIPVPVVGGRRLLFVEGSTRVLATLSNIGDENLDVVGLPSSRPSGDNMVEMEKLAKNATSITVVLDEDMLTNPDVAKAPAPDLRRAVSRGRTGSGRDRDPWHHESGVVAKVGLDDYLAKNPTCPGTVPLSSVLPWNTKAAIKEIGSEDWSRGTEEYRRRRESRRAV